MKILISTIMAIGLVFAVGVAYADEYMPIAPDLRSVVLDDNITYTAENGVSFVGIGEKTIECSSEGGMAAGGMAAEHVARPLENGATFFAQISDLGCSWARGLGRDLKIDNGVTYPGL